MVKLQYGSLCLGYFVTGRYSTTIQDTANLTELAYSRLEVIDPLCGSLNPWGATWHWSDLTFIEPSVVKLDYGKVSVSDISSFNIALWYEKLHELI